MPPLNLSPLNPAHLDPGNFDPRNFDPRNLEVLAAELARLADQVRRHRSTLAAAAGQLGWRSDAATEFEGRLSGVLGQLTRLGHRLDELARQLAEHAHQAARRAGALAELGQPVTGLARQLGAQLVHR